MNSHQLNAKITERPPIKVATSQICSDLVYGKSRNIIGDPHFINTIVDGVMINNLTKPNTDGDNNASKESESNPEAISE